MLSFRKIITLSLCSWGRSSRLHPHYYNPGAQLCVAVIFMREWRKFPSADIISFISHSHSKHGVKCNKANMAQGKTTRESHFLCESKRSVWIKMFMNILFVMESTPKGRRFCVLTSELKHLNYIGRLFYLKRICSLYLGGPSNTLPYTEIKDHPGNK